ncbi:MAG TPA: GGDEF domain-containing protein [Pyrinomonadaceae bacterium]|nr:GGDEF domain-containing protein [Pyrinomonadaceae bacterium]
MDSKIGLIIQLNGVILITVLSLCLRRSLRLTALKYWTMAWLCLSFALICLRLAFSYHEFESFLFTYYFFGEYMFGFMLVAGCRSLDSHYEIRPRSELLMIPFVIVSIVLPHVAADFNDVFNIHSIILAGFFAFAFYYLPTTNEPTFGRRVMNVSLALLTVDFILYAIVFTARQFAVFSTDFLAYNSVIDLVLQTALGFGMVIILLEKVLNDFKHTNEKLRSTQEELEVLVNTDPLTAAFNRHAFYGFVRRHGENEDASTGCVGFFDIDDLKAVNDCFGHAAGDMVIRQVVRSIREIIRAEDLIYRWGGDEFFVIMVSMDARMAEDRMRRLDSLLETVYIDNIQDPVSVGVSWGFENYASPDDLEKAIKTADSMMYKRKQERKQSRVASIDFIGSLPGGSPEFVQNR